MGLLEFNVNVIFPSKGYKSLLKKLETLLRYSATIGIHTKDGKKIVQRSYKKRKSQNNDYTNMYKQYTGHISGRGSKMTIAKLAYQNEFGANITIKPRYITKTQQTSKKTYNTLRQKYTHTTYRTYSALRGVRQQGYLLTDKQGNFVAYFKPNSKIRIPERSFIRKVIYKPNPIIKTMTAQILEKTFIKGGYASHSAIDKIAKLIEFQMKNNVSNDQKRNHPLTVKAKGSSTPLKDEKDRIRNSIKYKIYKDANVEGSKGYIAYRAQKIRQLESLARKADQYTKIKEYTTEKFTSLTYKGVNPNFF